jgi:hypothetical protein
VLHTLPFIQISQSRPIFGVGLPLGALTSIPACCHLSGPAVTAAYATITSRLGVVNDKALSSHLLARSGGIDDIAVVRRTGDSTWRLRVTVELYLYYYKGAGHRAREHDDMGL